MEGIADLIQCSICLETFTDPRMLPCIHTFCLKCLQQAALKKEEQQSETLNCPICRMEFGIPPQGVEGFQKNFFMLRLKDIVTITKPIGKSCDICLESKERAEDEVLPADVFCMQCRKNICRRCIKAHEIIAEGKEHQLIQIGTEITEDMIKTISQQDCHRHKNEQAKMYCNDCREVICVVCFAENHKTHTCSGVENVGDIFVLELKEFLSKVEICLDERLRKMQKCTDEKTNFQKNVEIIERVIIRRKNELISLIERSAHLSLLELASLRQTRLKKIQYEMDEHERQLLVIEKFKAYCKQVETKGTSAELCQNVPTLKRKAEEIQQTHIALCQQSTEVIQLDFEQTEFRETLKSESIIGGIKVVSDSIRSCGKLDIPSASRIYGLTKLENKICVLCRNPNTIRIFRDQDPFKLQTLIELGQIEEPYDMASSEKSKRLYVKEEGNTCIWKITIEDRRVTKWLTNGILFKTIRAGRGNLSVTSEGHLLLITSGHPSELDIYNSDANLIRHLTLPNDIFQPQHVICNPNGEFIISHREGTTVGPWVISRLTSDGQTVIGRFNAKDKTQELNTPCHFALYSDNDQLFVAEDTNDRVILLDPMCLTLIKILLTKKENGISKPCRVFYDGEKKQLVVGHWPNKVDVYEVSHDNYYLLVK